MSEPHLFISDSLVSKNNSLLPNILGNFFNSKINGMTSFMRGRRGEEKRKTVGLNELALQQKLD